MWGQSVETKCGDKVWRQGEGRATLYGRHACRPRRHGGGNCLLPLPTATAYCYCPAAYCGRGVHGSPDGMMKQVPGGAFLFSGFAPAISGLPMSGEPSSAKSTR